MATLSATIQTFAKAGGIQLESESVDWAILERGADTENWNSGERVIDKLLGELADAGDNQALRLLTMNWAFRPAWTAKMAGWTDVPGFE
jgi:hypothetical protein